MQIEPCPFCQGEATAEIETNGSGVFWIICDNDGCGCEGPYKHTEADAIAAWNRRAERDALRGHVQALLGQLHGRPIKHPGQRHERDAARKAITSDKPSD